MITKIKEYTGHCGIWTTCFKFTLPMIYKKKFLEGRSGIKLTRAPPRRALYARKNHFTSS